MKMKTKEINKSRIKDGEGLLWTVMSFVAFVLGILSGYDSNVCVSWFILGMIIQIYDEVRKLNEK